MKKIKVIIKRPGEKPYSTWISNTLENLQKTVEGYIETVTFGTGALVDPCFEEFVVICNEEGRIRGLPNNCKILGRGFVGTIIFAGVKDDEFADIPYDFQQFKRMLPRLFEEV